ncbi:hypothetical protein [Nonomuraea sp. NPDC050310]
MRKFLAAIAITLGLLGASWATAGAALAADEGGTHNPWPRPDMPPPPD